MPRPLDDLLARALAKPKGPERDAWIAGHCLDKPALEAELRELIEAHEAAGAFLSQPYDGPAKQDAQ